MEKLRDFIGLGHRKAETGTFVINGIILEKRVIIEEDEIVEKDAIVDNAVVVENDAIVEIIANVENDAIAENDAVVGNDAIVENAAVVGNEAILENAAIVENDAIAEIVAIVEYDGIAENSSIAEKGSIAENNCSTVENGSIAEKGSIAENNCSTVENGPIAENGSITENGTKIENSTIAANVRGPENIEKKKNADTASEVKFLAKNLTANGTGAGINEELDLRVDLVNDTVDMAENDRRNEINLNKKIRIAGVINDTPNTVNSDKIIKDKVMMIRPFEYTVNIVSVSHAMKRRASNAIKDEVGSDTDINIAVNVKARVDNAIKIQVSSGAGINFAVKVKAGVDRAVEKVVNKVADNEDPVALPNGLYVHLGAGILDEKEEWSFERKVSHGTTAVFCLSAQQLCDLLSSEDKSVCANELFISEIRRSELQFDYR